jgi:hypothetical protein
MDGFVAAGGDPSVPQDLLGVKTEYLQSSFVEVKTNMEVSRGILNKGWE